MDVRFKIKDKPVLVIGTVNGMTFSRTITPELARSTVELYKYMNAEAEDEVDGILLIQDDEIVGVLD